MFLIELSVTLFKVPLNSLSKFFFANYSMQNLCRMICILAFMAQTKNTVAGSHGCSGSS